MENMKKMFGKILVVLVLVALPQLGFAAIINVSPPPAGGVGPDVIANDGQCTLREAIIAATDGVASGQAQGECVAGDFDQLDTIQIPAGLFRFTIPEDPNNFLIESDLQDGVVSLYPSQHGALRLTGAGPDLTTIDAAGNKHVFEVYHGAGEDNIAVELKHMKLIGAVDGAGVLNTGTLFIENCIITENHNRTDFAHTGGGGGIANVTISEANLGKLTILSSQILGNSARFGAGILNLGEFLHLENSIVRNNTPRQEGNAAIMSINPDNPNNLLYIKRSSIAENNGPGIHINETATIEESAIVNNAGVGLKVEGERKVRVRRSTIALNGKRQDANGNPIGGPGIESTNPHLSLEFSVVAENALKGFKSGIYADTQTDGLFSIKGSLIFDNKWSNNVESNCSGKVKSLGYNVFDNIVNEQFCLFTEDSFRNLDIQNLPLLSSLEYNPLIAAAAYYRQQPGSPLINYTGVQHCPGNDQLDQAIAGLCDVGSIESSCGNSALNPGEACDDGNIIDNDQCSNRCALSTCGNGVINAGEVCDDGNNDNSDNCLNTCVVSGCGDGILGANETCDDNNVINGDGCDQACQIEDADGDAIANPIDNCPADANHDQADADADSVGDVCDPDNDNDGIMNAVDNCSSHFNPGQENGDADGLGDVCDDDSDGDGLNNAADNCPLKANADQADADNDLVGDVCDPAPVGGQAAGAAPAGGQAAGQGGAAAGNQGGGAVAPPAGGAAPVAPAAGGGCSLILPRF